MELEQRGVHASFFASYSMVGGAMRGLESIRRDTNLTANTYIPNLRVIICSNLYKTDWYQSVFQLLVHRAEIERKSMYSIELGSTETVQGS